MKECWLVYRSYKPWINGGEKHLSQKLIKIVSICIFNVLRNNKNKRIVLNLTQQMGLSFDESILHFFSCLKFTFQKKIHIQRTGVLILIGECNKLAYLV